MKEMGSRYLFIVLYVWLEKVLSRGDYQVREADAAARRPAGRSLLVVLAADHEELLAEHLPGRRRFQVEPGQLGRGGKGAGKEYGR